MRPSADWLLRRRAKGLPCSASEIARVFCYNHTTRRVIKSIQPEFREVYRDLRIGHHMRASEAEHATREHMAASVRREKILHEHGSEG